MIKQPFCVLLQTHVCVQVFVVPGGFISRGSPQETAATADEIHSTPVILYPSPAPAAATTGRGADQRETSKFRCRDEFHRDYNT